MECAAEYSTPEVGPAVTLGMTRLLDQPDGNVLMTYFPSVRVQVLGVDEDWVQVQVGDTESGHLTGYIAADGLAYTEDGIRAMLGRIVSYASANEIQILKECDEKSEEVGRTNLGWTRILGCNSDWIQVRSMDPPEKTGFVKGCLDDFEWIQNDAIDYCYTEPKTDEFSCEKAVEEAKRILLEQQTPYNGGEEPVTEKLLDACGTWVRCYYIPQNLESPLMYEVSFYSSDEMRVKGFSEIYTWINLEVKGDEIVNFGFGNG